MKIRIHGCSHLAPDGRVTQQTLTVYAAHAYSYYLGYPYLGVHTSNKRTPRDGWGTTRTQSCIEWILRDRRAIAFADASGLEPMPTPEACPLLATVMRMLYCDHASVWTSAKGTQFVLSEPYGKTYIKELDKLHDAGLARIEVPTPLAPYGGDWSDASGAQPGTRSFVIGFKSDEAELQEIAMKLIAAADRAPAWNDTAGLV